MITALKKKIRNFPLPLWMSVYLFIVAIIITALAYIGVISRSEPVPPVLSGEQVSNITKTSADISGIASPPGVTARGVEYGPTNSYGTTQNDNNSYSQTYNYITNWTPGGGELGSLILPSGMAIDDNDDVYVIWDNAKVQKYDSDGNYISQFGSGGSGNGQFNQPRDIALDSIGNIYVADTLNNRIQKFDTNGDYLMQWGIAGSGNGQFNNPYGLAIDANDRIYVSDINNNRIQVFNSGGTYLFQFGSFGSGDGQIYGPNDIAIEYDAGAGQEILYVADTGNHRVQKLDLNGNFIAKFGSQGSADGQLSFPRGIAVDQNNDIFIVDYFNYRVQKFTNNGTFITKWGQSGTGNGQFNLPHDVVLTSTGEVIISDTWNNRVQKFAGTTPLTVNLSGLQCNTTYHYRVFATDGAGTGYGNDRTFTTLPCVGVPQNVSGTAHARSVDLTWNSVADADYYQIEYKKSSDSTWLQFGGAIYDTSETVNTLDALTSYDFRVRGATMSPTYGEWSSTYTISTTAVPTYTITDCVELQSIAFNPITYQPGDLTANYELANDIDCSESVNWTWNGIIPSNTEPIGFLPIMDFGLGYFSGNFDGNGHTISNVFQDPLSLSMGSFPTGIFGATSGSTIVDTNIDNSDITSAISRDFPVSGAGFIGLAQNTTIQNVHVTNLDLTATPGNSSGGLVANMVNSTIENSSVNGSIDVVEPDTSMWFNGPSGMTTDSQGNVYVIDSSNGRLMKYDSNGNFLLSIGNYGDRFDELAYPTDVAVDPSGNIYITDTANNQVKKFDSNGNYISSWGSGPGSGNGEFSQPYGIAVDAQNNIYVADGGNSRVQKFDSNGNYLDQFGTYGYQTNEFIRPYAIAIDQNGNIFVSDTGAPRVKKFDSSHNPLTQWYNTACIENGPINDGDLCSPTDLAIDSGNNVLVADASNHRIQKFDNNGNFISKFGTQGSGNGQFNDVRGVAIGSSGSIYTAEYFNSRIQKFDSNGQYISKWGKYGRAAISDYQMVGGLVGTSDFQVASKSEISNSYANVSINSNIFKTQEYDQVGGLLGVGNVDISNSYAWGLINIDGQDSLDPIILTGGLAGQLQGVSSNVYSTVNVQISNTSALMVGAGGLIGSLYGNSYIPYSSLQNAFAKGSVSSVPSSSIPSGGLIGAVVVEANAEVAGNNNFYDISASTQADCVGAYMPIDVSSIVPDPQTFCSGVNNNNTQPNYFINNNTNPPLSSWDFTNVWRRKSSTTPTFEGTNDPVLTEPEVPQNLQASADSSSSITLTWQAPSSNGGSPITDYVIQYKLSSSGSWQTFNDGTGTNTTATITGLSQGTAYDIRVAATNSIGSGNYTSPATATTLALPTVPQSLAVSDVLSNRISLNWQAPSSNGGSPITDYVIQYKLSSSGSWQTFNDGTGTNTTATITSLAQGTTYNVRVAAVNVVGQGSYASPATATTLEPPSAPQNLQASADSSSSITLTWQAPSSNGGSPITDYVIQYKLSSSGSWQTFNDGTGTNRTEVITDLSSGNIYDIRVAAANLVGVGSNAEVSNVTVNEDLPSTPQNLTVSSYEIGNEVILPKISWDPPASGGPVSDYVIEFKQQDQPESDWQRINDGASTATSIEYDFGLSLNNANTVSEQELDQYNEVVVNKTFEFKVAAVNTSGQSGFTNPENFVINKENPEQAFAPSPNQGDSQLVANNQTFFQRSQSFLLNVLNPVKGVFTVSLVNFAAQIPKPVAKALPYSLMSVLVVIALAYIYLAYLEIRRRNAIQALIDRFKQTLGARTAYMQLTSHYINTPIAKMQGATELLKLGSGKNDQKNESNEKIPESLLVAADSQLKKLNLHASELLTEGQSLSSVQQANVHDLSKHKGTSFITNPAFWLPASTVFVLALLLNFILIRADRYSTSNINFFAQAIMYIVGVVVVALSLLYLKQSKTQRALSEAQEAIEKEVLHRQFNFIASTHTKLSDDLLVINDIAEKLKRYPKTQNFDAGTQELNRIVNQLEKINSMTKNIPGLKWNSSLKAQLSNSVLDLKDYANKNKVSIVIKDIQEHSVNIDKTSLNHLLQAPLKNAIEASTMGSQVIITGSQKIIKDKGGAYVQLTITDYGKGIAKDKLANIFKPFNQSGSVEQFSGTGLGLDLAVAKVVAINYGADIALDSQAGKGTIVTLTLPLSSQ